MGCLHLRRLPYLGIELVGLTIVIPDQKLVIHQVSAHGREILVDFLDSLIEFRFGEFLGVLLQVLINILKDFKSIFLFARQDIELAISHIACNRLFNHVLASSVFIKMLLVSILYGNLLDGKGE